MYDIVMICTGNICRSPMAEGMLKSFLPKKLVSRTTIHSAGTHALDGDPATALSIATMKSMGIDISRHRARLLTAGIVNTAHLLLAMETEHLRVIQRLADSGNPDARLIGAFAFPPENSAIDDPYGGPLAHYQACADKLRPCIEKLIKWLEKKL